MNTILGFHDVAPPGAGLKLVDDNDQAVTPRLLAIEASSMKEARRILKKYHDYRLWDQLQSLGSHPEVMPADESGNLATTIQKLFSHNDDESSFNAGVDSVTLTYPKAMQPKVTAQLSSFPPRLPFVQGSSFTDSGKSIHVESREGTRSLVVLERPLDIEVSDTSIFVCLNNPAKPGLVVAAPRDKPPMLFERNLRAVSANDIAEKAAWDKVSLWLESRGFTVSSKPYPNGENSFPDYRAWIDGSEFDVEMTSVPNMTEWTLKETFRKLEGRISEIAKQPGQTRAEVIEEFLRKCCDKRHRVKNTAIGDQRRPCMLVVSNWSAHALVDECSRLGSPISFFDVVMLIEFDEVYCVYPEHLREDGTLFRSPLC